MQKNILVVTKDRGAFNATNGIVKKLRKDLGHTVKVYAEGLSAGLWEEAGEKLAFKGSVDFLKESFTLNVAEELEKFEPDVIVVGASVPINLEAQFAAAAVERRKPIPVVVAEDSFGGATRIQTPITLALTLHPLAAGFYEAEGILKGVPTVAMGGESFRRIELSADKPAEVEKLREQFDTLVLYAGQGRPFTRDILRMTLDCIDMTRAMTRGERIGLIVRHHPKVLPPEVAELIKADLAAFRSGKLVETTLSSDEAASVCDFTFTCFGSALNYSAVHGHIPVSVMTDESEAQLREQTGFGVTPLAAVGAAILMRSPVSFPVLRLNGESLEKNQRLYATPHPLDPSVAADAILSVAR